MHNCSQRQTSFSHWVHPNSVSYIINKKATNIKKDLWEIKIKHRMLSWSSPPRHKSLTYGMVRTRGSVYCPPLSAVTWQVCRTGALGHHPWHGLNSILSLPTYLCSPFHHSWVSLSPPSVLSHNPSLVFSLWCLFCHIHTQIPNIWYHYPSRCNWYVLPAWQDFAPLMIFSAPLPLPVTFSHFSHNSCLPA